MKILFTGGGTGGHIIPIISIVREIRLLYPIEDLELMYVGPRDAFSMMLLRGEGIEIRSVLAGKIRRYWDWKSILQNIFDVLIKIPIGIIQACWHVFWWAPDVVFSKGGYGSFPVVFAAWMMQVPIFLHESDVSPGLANRIISKFALEIFVSFPKTEYFHPQKSIIVGNPIRRSLLEGSTQEAKKKFNLSGEKPILFIMGGSQGAQRINDVILAALPDLVQEFELIHQTGEFNFNAVKAEADVVLESKYKKYYHPVPFLREQDLRDVYAAADLIVARSGSGTIFEIAAVGKPSILIPLSESAQNHQYKNAYAYAAHGAAIVLEEANFLPHFFLERLRYLFSDPEILEKMRQAAKRFAMPKSGQIIAAYLLDYVMT